ncbi:MAG: hypothetical protein COA82_12965 [Alkaliphilus sp.]|nr:RloB domain-containing protein [bacterium AH-315-K05]MBN4074736.1 RloB domain-containing protein [bacterium AH-315-E09]PHS29153.1 MAG: hypothetical protein COA82_12965 [Alkaliphilus sp.]
MSKKPLKKSDIKRKMEKKKRKEGSKLAQPEKYLIICEGEKTEPNYFEGIKKKIEEKYDRRIHIETEGTGRNTLSLLEYAKAFVVSKSKNGELYDHVWLVYDLDDFPRDNFDNTADATEALNKVNAADEDSPKWHVAWSNQCIELWFLLHFNYYNSNISRREYFEKLAEIFKDRAETKYEKNDQKVFEFLSEHGDLEFAINNAKRLCEESKGKSPSQMVPATTVYKLVEKLLPHFKEI